MSGAAITGTFVLAAMGSLFLLLDRHHAFARVCIRVGVIGALIFCTLQIFPTGDRAAHNVAELQPSAFAAMEGMFETEQGAPLVILGNPDTEQRKLDSSLAMPHFLSFLTSHNWNERLTGLNDIPVNQWPDSVPLVYYAYHIMVGLGTILVGDRGARRAAAVAGQALHEPLDALDPHARVPVHLHRQHRGVGDGGNRAPAVGRLRGAAHERRRLARRVGAGRHGDLHAAGLHGPVPVPGDPLPRADPAAGGAGPDETPAPAAPSRRRPAESVA